MRVKKDGTTGVGNQGNADAIPTATQVGGGKPSDGQGSPDDGEIDNLFSDPHFMSMMQQYSLNYPQQGVSTSMPFVDPQQFQGGQPYPGGGGQYPVGAQYPWGVAPNMDLMDMLDDDDDDEDDDYFKSALFPPPQMQQQVPIPKPQSSTQPSRSNMSATLSKPVQYVSVSAASSLANSLVNSQANSLVSSRVNSPSSLASPNSTMELDDSQSGAAQKEDPYKLVGSNLLVNDSSSSNSAFVDGQQSNQVSALHSYSLPAVIAKKPVAPSATATVDLGDIIYTDGNILNNPNVSLVEIASTSQPVLTSQMDTSQLAIVTSSASQSVTSQSGGTQIMMTSPLHAYASSPETTSGSVTTSPIPADIIISSAGGSKGKAKSSSKRTKSSTSGGSSTQRKKTKSGDTHDEGGISFTPVETITDIVDRTKLESDDLLKEVITKPIRHQTEISVDKAHNRSVKNAINARVNRQKHKQFVASLEDENTGLRNRISELENYTEVLKTEKDVLNQEIQYLKSVIANETTIGNVLSGLGNVKNVRLSSGFLKKYRKRAAATADSTSQSNDAKMSRDSDGTAGNTGCDVKAGVCLHVRDENVSVEFCDQCASYAAEGLKP